MWNQKPKIKVVKYWYIILKNLGQTFVEKEMKIKTVFLNHTMVKANIDIESFDWVDQTIISAYFMNRKQKATRWYIKISVVN